MLPLPGAVLQSHEASGPVPLVKGFFIVSKADVLLELLLLQ